jgi:hypothetical protein
VATSTFLPKPKGPVISRLMPTVAVGQPMPQMQQIPEPVDGIGRWTGIKHFALGDGGAPEAVHVQPTAPGAPSGDAPGEVPYATGGSFMVGPTFGSAPDTSPWYQGATQGANDIAQTYGGQGSSSYYNPPSQAWYGQSGGSSPSFGGVPGYYSPPSQAYFASGTTNQPRYPGDPVAALYSARAAQLAAQQQGLSARTNGLYAQQGALAGQNNVLNATAGTFGPQTAARNAQGQLINLQGQQNQLQRGYLQQSGQNDQQRLSELAGIYAASQNTPDILRAAEAQDQYNAEDRRDASLGVSAPTTVALAPGQTTGGQPGVRGAIQTQEQALTRQAGYQDPIRAQQLALAQNAVQLQGTDVEQARLAAQQAGLTLDQANQLVAEARNQAGYSQEAATGAGIQSQFADVATQQAGLGVTAAQTPPAPGLVSYTDPDTGQSQWLTPGEAELRQAEYNYGPNGIYTQRLQQGLTSSQARTSVLGYTRAELVRGLKTGQIDDATALQWYIAHGYDQDTAQTALAIDKHSSSGGVTTLDANGNPTG